jgi:hypothetical protein
VRHPFTFASIISQDPRPNKLPTIILDSEGRTVVVRTAQAQWLKENALEFQTALLDLVESTLTDPKAREDFRARRRGGHFACLIGLQRQYSVGVILTQWHKKNEEAILRFLATSIIQRLM